MEEELWVVHSLEPVDGEWGHMRDKSAECV